MAYSGRTEFRATRGALLLQVAMAAVVLVIAIVASVTDSEMWVRVVCWFILVVGVLAVADTVVFYLALAETELRMRRNFRTVVVSRTDVESVSAEKGCPIMLILHSGEKIEVPSHGVSGLANSLRAWVRATPR